MLIRDNITFTTTDIPSTINTHNTELQIVKVHINNTKLIAVVISSSDHNGNGKYGKGNKGNGKNGAIFVFVIINILPNYLYY